MGWETMVLGWLVCVVDKECLGVGQWGLTWSPQMSVHINDSGWCFVQLVVGMPE